MNYVVLVSVNGYRDRNFSTSYDEFCLGFHPHFCEHRLVSVWIHVMRNLLWIVWICSSTGSAFPLVYFLCPTFLFFLFTGFKVLNKGVYDTDNIRPSHYVSRISYFLISQFMFMQLCFNERL